LIIGVRGFIDVPQKGVSVLRINLTEYLWVVKWKEDERVMPH
jgi:hypothetical protein